MTEKTMPTDATSIDWADYDIGAAAKPKKPFPPAGLYTLRIPQLTTDIFATGDEGQLKAEIGPLFIVGGEYDGFEIRFCTISNKRYSNRNASQMGDYLLAAASPFRPQSEDQWKQAVLATGNGLVQAGLDWSAWDKTTKTSLAEKMTGFPVNPDGTHQRWINVKLKAGEVDAKAKDGERRVWANIKVAYFRVPRKEGAAPSATGGTTPTDLSKAASLL